jgi:threonine/homoserine/homoserine lactone efflux protein
LSSLRYKIEVVQIKIFLSHIGLIIIIFSSEQSFFFRGSMLTGLFLKGSLIGFSLAMPIGPVGMLCIQHSLRRGLLAGLIAGSGAALADALFGCMAGFGVSLLSHVVTRYQIWLQIIGSFVLWYLGIKIFKSQPAPLAASEISFSCSRVFFSTFVLTLTIPA